MDNKQMKDAQCHLSSSKCQLKPQKGTTSPSLE